jgi:hypothetical protein
MVFHESFLRPKLSVWTKFCLILSHLWPKSFTSWKYCSYLIQIFSAQWLFVNLKYICCLRFKGFCDKGTPFSRIVVASNVWAVITETVRNPIFIQSHQMLLINQRCWPSIKWQMCFFFLRCLWMLIDATIGVDQHSHTHTLSLSLSLSYLAFFLHHFLPFINSFCSCVCINWNIDFTAFGCSHFQGYTKLFLSLKKYKTVNH